MERRGGGSHLLNNLLHLAGARRSKYPSRRCLHRAGPISELPVLADGTRKLPRAGVLARRTCNKDKFERPAGRYQPALAVTMQYSTRKGDVGGGGSVVYRATVPERDVTLQQARQCASYTATGETQCSIT